MTGDGAMSGPPPPQRVPADVWLGRAIKGESDPFHPMGIPPHVVPRVLPGSFIDPDLSPTFDEACEALRGRLATLGGYVDALDFDELTFHNHFINRDLDKSERVRA